MNKRPGHVDVTTEVGYCNFCTRTRNLRREEHHLGNFVRTIVTCETCHRTLSSSMGVAQPEPEAAPEPQPEPAKEEVPAKPAATKRAAPKKATTTARAKTPAKRTSTKK